MKTFPTLVLAGVAILGALFTITDISAQTEKGDKVIKDGSVVSFEYTLSDEKGEVIESNKGKKPMTYTHGESQIIPGLEKELSGMSEGAEKNIRVKPEDAYGPVNPQAFQEVPREKLPAEAQKVGAALMARSPQGQPFPVRVHEVKEKTVVLDLNHPLAGKTLTFDVKILNVQQAEAAK
ncbi:MAG: peptidylprolyl isomerase [Deltaproteobacteria bacterium]|nr:peptidylprolyl isomerase [Deltaproteobacteria bacterium]